MIVFTFLLYAVIGLVIGVMFEGTVGGLIGFMLGVLIYKVASSLVQFDEREEL
jgi:ribose/xylose/arabinose/galactoside ABC-type transport system permease subunit